MIVCHELELMAVLNSTINKLEKVLAELNPERKSILPFTLMPQVKNKIESALNRQQINEKDINNLNSLFEDLIKEIDTNSTTKINVEKDLITNTLKSEPWNIEEPIFNLSTVSFVEIVENFLFENAIDACEKLTSFHHLKKLDDLEVFKALDKESFDFTEKFMHNYYMAMQITSNSLDSEQIIHHLEGLVKDAKYLIDKISNYKLEDDELKKDLQSRIEMVALVAEEKLNYIKDDVKKYQSLFDELKEEVFDIKEENGEIQVHLKVEKPPEELPGFNNHLNYQFKNILDTNTKLINELDLLLEKHNVNKVYVKDVSVEDLRSFFDAVKNDKAMAKDIIEKGLGGFDEEPLSSITEEIAFNLIYRLCWEARVSIVAINA